jgi:hypothetical protein
MRNFLRFICGVLIILIIVSCSTENNTFINRTYHGTTARYNGYFNANELIRLGITSYRTTLKEDYYDLLPIDPLPNEKDVLSLYPAIDTAIAKCTKVIQNHSMPSNDRPSKKKEEHNPWIDENWLTVGKASFYRRDYDAALKNFRFIKKFYKNDPTLYKAELWIAKTNIELKKYTEAGFNLEKLDKAIEEEEARKKATKLVKRITNKFILSKKKKEGEPAKFPKKIKFDLQKTKAELALKTNNKEDAITFLKESLKFAKKKQDKARVNFILGQLLESVNNREEAKYHYSRVLKYNSNYDLIFAAKIKRAFMGGSLKLRKELMKMLRDPKNAAFKDQIYYALADMELQNGNIEEGKVNLTLSAFYSTTNTRQKGMAYEKLGNMSFSERNYVTAQKYYDSCANVINDAYPNAEGIRIKVVKLADLVKAVETAYFEDSVQRIAQLSEKDRITFIENVIVETKKAIEIRKQQEARRLLELQKNKGVEQSGGGVNNWYWNNAKLKASGYDEFRRLWGSDRENEDDWRRSQKIVVATFTENDSIPMDSAMVKKEVKDTLTVEYLIKRIPLTDSLFAASQQKMVEAYYNAGIIYKDQLNEKLLAEIQFLTVLEKTFKNPFTLLSAFQLYKLFEEKEESKANEYKNYILNNYPNSDYANFLRDPDYFIKKKELDKIALDEYLLVLERYNNELYPLVILKADNVINNERKNIFRPKYILLKAMSIGMTSEDKSKMKPVLELIVQNYPKTEESERALELLSIIEKGVSENKEVDFTKKSIYEYNENDSYYLLIFLDEKQNSNNEKGNVVDFDREFFSRLKLKVSSKIFGGSQNVIFVEGFENQETVQEYLSTFKSTRKHITKLHNNTIIIISKKNLKTLFETQNLSEYETFSIQYF